MSFSSDDFAKALEGYDYQFQRGQIVRGRVASCDSTGVYVDIGGKAAAFLPTGEASLQPYDSLSELLPVDLERDFMIIREQDADGQVTLSVRQLEIKRVWDELEELQTDSQTVQAKVNGTNRGGLTVNVQGIRGFVPRSHVIDKLDLEAAVGRVLTVSILEIDRDRRRLVLSERMATQAASLNRLAIGQLIYGKISNIKPFGLFVDFEGVTGLLHINQISQTRISALEPIFSVGQSIKALILDIDTDKRRISLSTKLLENYPGEIQEKFEDVMSNADERLVKARKALEQQGILREA